MSRAAIPALGPIHGRWPENMLERAWRPVDGISRCQSCQGCNPTWWVEDRLWMDAVGHAGGILCPTCFLLLCEEKGIGRSGSWQLYPPAVLCADA